jgi:hypothetical protein
MFITLDGVIEAPEKWNPPFLRRGAEPGGHAAAGQR